jgi:hypothetical protein
MLAILFKPFRFIAPKTLNHLAFQSFDFERTRRMHVDDALNLIFTFITT